MAEANSINSSSAGIVGNNGTGFTSTAVTQYNVITGASTTSTLNNIAPSATSGVPLISQGSSSQPIFGTATIAGGGTNATSFTQSNGIVAYNGTSLINYAGPQLSSGGVMTNTTQPSFLFYLNGNTAANVTGDGTTYTLGTDALTQAFQQGSGMSTNGTFTAPVAGFYSFTVRFYLFGLISSHTSGNCSGAATSHTELLNWMNPFASAVSGEFMFGNNFMVNMAASDTCTFKVQISNGTKVVGLGGVSGGLRTCVSGYLIC